MAEQREGGIRTKETKHLTLSHIQVETFHRKDLAEYFCKIFSMDHIASLLITRLVQVFIGLIDQPGLEFQR